MFYEIFFWVLFGFCPGLVLGLGLAFYIVLHGARRGDFKIRERDGSWYPPGTEGAK